MNEKDVKMESGLETLLEELAGSDNSAKNVKKIDQYRLLIEGETYVVVKDHKDGYDYQAFLTRYQDYFSKFDYIVGDWAFEQLRLRGFYQLGTRKVPYDQKIDSLEDYLNEYCNFGCQYFVLAKEASLEDYPDLVENMLEDTPKVGRADLSRPSSTSRRSRRRRPNKNKSTKQEKNVKSKSGITEQKTSHEKQKQASSSKKVSASTKEEFQIRKTAKRNNQSTPKARKTLTHKQNFTIKQKEK